MRTMTRAEMAFAAYVLVGWFAASTVWGELKPVSVPVKEGFETDLASLRAGGWKFKANCGLISTDRPKFGGKCLQVSIPDARGKYAQLYVPVEPGKCYRAAVWVRCKDVKRVPEKRAKRGAVIFAQWVSREKKHVPGGAFPPGLFGTHDWTLREAITRAIPKDVGYIDLLLGVDGVGTAWFDGLTVEEITGIDPRWDLKVVSPGEGDTVGSRRTLLKWAARDGATGYRVDLSDSSDFPENRTTSLDVVSAECRPPEALSPGKWFWRIHFWDRHEPAPPGRVHSFVVPETASFWPPAIRPKWSWTDAARPELTAAAGPPEAVKQVTVHIDQLPAELISYDNGIIRFRPRTDLKPGVHDVKIRLHGPRQEVLTRSFVFGNNVPGSRVTIRDDKVLLLDGKPFFPIGAYRDPSDTLTDFSGLLEAGFNLTHSYKFEGGGAPAPDLIDRAKKYLADADRHGIKVFMGINRRKGRYLDTEWLTRWTAELMDSPALLTWYLWDEPGRVVAGKLERIRQAIGKADPFHPSSLVSNHPWRFEQLAQVCDILWTDPYPIGRGRPLRLVDQWTQRARQAASGKPVWVVIQAFDPKPWGSFKAGRKVKTPVTRPTYTEMRCMTHMALAAGAKGIIYYWTPRQAYHIRKQAPEVWRGLCKIVKELRGLTDFLIARHSTDDKIVTPEPFRTWSRQSAGRRVLAVVNTSKNSEKIDLDLSHFGQKQIHVRIGDEPALLPEMSLTDGKLTATFGPHEVRIYEWSTSR